VAYVTNIQARLHQRKSIHSPVTGFNFLIQLQQNLLTNHQNRRFYRKTKTSLVGGFSPIETYARQIWIISSIFGLKIKNL